MGPLCGMTRGSVALLRGHVTEAVRDNLTSPLVLFGGVASVVRGLLGSWRGGWLAVRVRMTTGWQAPCASAWRSSPPDA